MSTFSSDRKERTLVAALEVFGRYGFRKTSMEDVARAADISRQGLYLHFASKEDLFRAAISQELGTALLEVSACLNQHGVALEQRIVAALDAWLGRYVGTQLASEIGHLLKNPAVQLGNIIDVAVTAFDAQLADAIGAELTDNDRRRLGMSPQEIAAALHTIGQGSKYLSSSRAEFNARASAATHLALSSLSGTKTSSTKTRAPR